MTTIAPTCDNAKLWVGSGGSAVSEAASIVRRLMFRDVASQRAQPDPWCRVPNAIQSLNEAYAECSENNWDGYGSLPITAGAYEEALSLLKALPYDLPMPEIVPEPDGSIGLEWQHGPDRIFAVSVNGKGVIVYAGLIGKGVKAHGTEVFNDSLPEGVVGSIKRVYR